VRGRGRGRGGGRGGISGTTCGFVKEFRDGNEMDVRSWRFPIRDSGFRRVGERCGECVTTAFVASDVLPDDI
jgi:hypothetical protein